MRKLAILIFITALLVGCKSEESKVKDAVKKYIKDTMHDPSSYESVYFSSLDTLSWEEVYPGMSEMKKSLEATQSDPEKLEDIMLMEKIYKNGKERNYRIIHQFRGKNAFGATVLNEKVFKTSYVLDKIYVSIEE